MSTHDKNSTGVTLAVAAGGALLFWLLWRGRGKGKAKSKGGDRSSASAAVQVWILSGDRLALDRSDGANVDLATVVDLARAAGVADTHPTGDARHGWVETVHKTLEAAGVNVRTGAPISTTRGAQ